jgi:hypothetical protein
VWTSIYQDTYGPVQPDSFRSFVAGARRQGTPLPPLLLDSVRCLPFRLEQVGPSELEKAADAAKHVDDQARLAATIAGRDELRVVGEYQSGAELVDNDDTFALRFLFAFWRLCEQRLAAVESPSTTHAATVMAGRVDMSGDVRVVRLRQRDTDARRKPGPSQWHHRWVVRMHKVRQWYPSENRHKVIYRGPYVKGPRNKPLLTGETVRALMR